MHSGPTGLTPPFVVFSWRRFRERVTNVLHFDEEPSRLACGMAVGVFIGITPFYGLHTLLAFAVAFCFRLNKAATVTGAWINLPWFAPFIYVFCLKLGETILRGHVGVSWETLPRLAEATGAYLQAGPREHVGTFWKALWDMMFTASKPLFVGTTVVGITLAIPTYFITRQAIHEIRRLSARAHPARSGPDEPSGPREPQP